MYDDCPPPNSTPPVATPVSLTGSSAASLLGVLVPSGAGAAPGLRFTLTGTPAALLVGAVTVIPSTVVLSGVQAFATISLSDTPITPQFAGLRGVRTTNGLGYFGGVPTVPPPPTPPTGYLNIINLIKGLQVTTGPYAGVYETVPNGQGNWYNGNVALMSICKYLTIVDLGTYVLPYLDLYINQLNGNGSISDIQFNSGRANTSDATPVDSANDDNYAATFLSLVRRYLTASQNWTWYDTNKAKLLIIADNNILGNRRTNGLVASFQYPRRTSLDVGLLSNNVEDYAGLTDLVSILTERGDATSAQRFSTAMPQLSSAVDTLRVATGQFSPGYLAKDSDLVLSSIFYPNVVSHAYMQASGMSSLSNRFTANYAYVNANAPGWENCNYDSAPWAVLGLSAALQLDTTKANAQLSIIDGLYTANPASIGINELGMYQRIKSVLAGSAPT